MKNQHNNTVAARSGGVSGGNFDKTAVENLLGSIFTKNPSNPPPLVVEWISSEFAKLKAASDGEIKKLLDDLLESGHIEFSDHDAVCLPAEPKVTPQPDAENEAARDSEGLTPDLGTAGQFIEALTGNRDTVITVQTFSDNDATKTTDQDGKKHDPLAKIMHGTLTELSPKLSKLNQQGAGIFICVNQTDLKGRKAKNITAVRAVWGDFDKPFGGTSAVALALAAGEKLPPSIEVESSPCKRHLYWLTDGIAIDGFRPVIDCLTAAIDSDTNAATIERVLRIPGFYHRKGTPVMVKLIAAHPERRYTAERIVAAFGLDALPVATSKPPERAEFDALAYVLSEQKITDLRAALKHLDANKRDVWFAVCAALCRSGEAGFELFHEWSKTATTNGKHGYQSEADCRAKFTETAPSAKSAPEAIFTMAQAAGRINKPTEATGFRFIPLRELADSTIKPRWVLKHWFERDTITCIAGQPKHGKSFIAFDIGMHVASGMPWCGKRVEQGPVFVICGEGQGGTSRRTKGWLSKHPEVSKDVPFHVSNQSIQLDAAGAGAEKVKSIIEGMCKEHVVSPSMIIIDTLARSFPGDENKTEDMNTFVAALDTHLKAMDVALVIVHHSTKSGSDVLRGNSALRGALDGLIEVVKADTPSPSGGILSEVKPHWLKDGGTPAPLFFDCEVVSTGLDEDLEEITTLVPKMIDQPGAAAALSDIERQALEILRGLQGEDVRVGIPLRVWRDACVAADVIDGPNPKAIARNMERRVVAGLSASDSIFKPGGNDGKYRAVIYASFDNQASE